MAAIYKCSYDEKRIKRFLLWNKINSDNFICLRNKSEAGSYFAARGKKVLFDYDGSNCVFIRIDPYAAQCVKNIIDYKRFKEYEETDF
jgi:hypothetical protein